MFRPNSSKVFSVNPSVKPSLSVSEGPLITTLTIAASAWTTAVVRLTKGEFIFIPLHFVRILLTI